MAKRSADYHSCAPLIREIKGFAETELIFYFQLKHNSEKLTQYLMKTRLISQHAMLSIILLGGVMIDYLFFTDSFMFDACYTLYLLKGLVSV